MARIDDLIEANRRGLLTGQIKVDFDNAVSKGIINLPQADNAFQPQTREQKDAVLQELLNQQLAGGGELTREQRRTGQPSQLQQQVTKARQLSALPTREEAADITRQQGFEELNTPLTQGQSFDIAVGRGLTDFARGVSDLTGIGSVEQEAPIAQQALQDLGERRPISQTAGQIAGQVLPLAPLGAASVGIEGLGLRSLVQGLIGSSEGAAIAQGTGGDPVVGAAFGAFGALASPLIRVGKLLNTKLTDRAIRQSGIDDTIKNILINESDDVRALGFKLVKGNSKIEKSPSILQAAKQAEIQGITRPESALITSTNKATGRKLTGMLDIAAASLNSAASRNKSRVSDVVGLSFSKRLAVLARAQRKAGRDIDRAARNFDPKIKRIGKGELKIDPTKFETNFVKNLRDIDVRVSKEGIGFSGSIIEGESTTEKVLKLVADRFSKIDRTDPLALHKFKRFIDSKVTFGKSSEGGLNAQANNVVKTLRREINDELKGLSPAYDRANTDYSDIINALEPFKQLTGKKIDALTDAGKASSIGTLFRRELSNAPSRNPVFEARNNIDKLAKRFGGNFSDNLDQQIILTDILEGLDLSPARTSIKGQVAAPIISRTQLVTEGLKKGAELLKKKQTPEEAIKAIRELIRVSR